MGAERVMRHHLFRDFRGQVGGDPARGVDPGQFPNLCLGVSGQL